MKVKELELFSFRNINEAHVRLSDGMNFLIGENAQGKTNALEAIYLFARGKSFRGASDAEMISFGKDCFSARLVFETREREEELFYGCSKKEKVRKRNGVLLERQAELLGHFRAVLFSPDHLQMIKGAPSERRRFLDVAISQCYPAYLGLYARYLKLLENRNALLKDMQKGRDADENALLAFSERMAQAAAEIYLYRRKYVIRLSRHAADIMRELSRGKEEMKLSYQSDLGFMPHMKEGEEIGEDDLPTQSEVEDGYRMLLCGSFMKEALTGSSLYGVHRDELQIYLSGIKAREYGSQGQQRSAVLSLKMAEGRISEEIAGDAPVYLFDDVLSELDEGRRDFLLHGMKGYQFIVTGCEKGVLGAHAEDVHFIDVKDGVFTS